MKKKKRALSLLLVLCMVTSMYSPALAKEDSNITEIPKKQIEYTEAKSQKRQKQIEYTEVKPQKQEKQIEYTEVPSNKKKDENSSDKYEDSSKQNSIKQELTEINSSEQNSIGQNIAETNGSEQNSIEPDLTEANNAIDMFSEIQLFSVSRDPTQEEVYDCIMSFKDIDGFKEGTIWTDDTHVYIWNGGMVYKNKGDNNSAYCSGSGCVAFAFILSDAAFGYFPTKQLFKGKFKFKDVKVGDILRMNNDTHSVIITKVLEDSIEIAESNIRINGAKDGIVHWGRTLTKSQVEAADYLLTRYPEDSTHPTEEVLGKGEIDNILWKVTQDGKLIISGEGEMPDFTDATAQPWHDLNNKIKTIEIRYGATKIGNNAFYGSSATDITISDSVEVIGDNAFRDCSKITSIEVPDSVTQVGTEAFRGCEELSNVVFASSDNVVIMGKYTFADCGQMETITLPKMKSIPEGMFYQTIKSEMYCWLTDVIIPEGVETIEDNAFYYCRSLKTITIPSTVTEIKKDAFYKVENLHIYFDGDAEMWNNIYIDSSVFSKDPTIHYQDKFYKLTMKNSFVIKDGNLPLRSGTFTQGERLWVQTELLQGKLFKGWASDRDSNDIDDGTIIFTPTPDSFSGLDSYFTMPAYDVTVFPIFEDAYPSEKYTLTVVNGEGSGEYEYGEIVSIKAENKTAEGKIFKEWQSDWDGVFASSIQAHTKFTMPNNDVTITAIYEDAPNSGTDPDNPGTDPDNPGTDPDNPGTDPDNPGTDPDNPGTDPDNPGTNPDNPGTDPDNPGTDPDKPSTDPDKPSTDPDKPSTDPDKPSTDPDKPSTDPDKPSTDPDKPSTDPDNPGTDPDNPGTDPDNPGTDPDNPGTDPDNPGTKPNEPSVPNKPNVPSKPDTPDTPDTPSKSFIITFAANGGNIDGETLTIAETDKTGKLTSLPTPVRSNYTFDGWFTDKRRGEEITIDTVFTQDTTVYAHWTFKGSSSSSGGGGSSSSHRGSSGGSSSSKVTASNQKAKVYSNKPGGTVVANNDGTVTITPDNGYQVTAISINGQSANIPQDGRLTNLTSSDTVNVRFEKIGSSNEFVAVQPSNTSIDRFIDISKTAWYYESVKYVVEQNLFSGVSARMFAPNDTMTRAMLMTVLARMNGQEVTGGSTWYEKGMNWAKANNISDGTNPTGDITREQLAAMLFRYANSPATSGNLTGFSDTDKVSNYAKTALCWAVENNLIYGKDKQMLDPKGKATRAEVAAILMRFCEIMKNR